MMMPINQNKANKTPRFAVYIWLQAKTNIDNYLDLNKMKMCFQLTQ